MGYIHNKIPDIKRKINSFGSNNYSESYAKDLIPFIKLVLLESEKLFSSEKDSGQNANTGGKGMEMALYKRLVELVDKK